MSMHAWPPGELHPSSISAQGRGAGDGGLDDSRSAKLGLTGGCATGATRSRAAERPADVDSITALRPLRRMACRSRRSRDGDDELAARDRSPPTISIHSEPLARASINVRTSS